MSQIAHLEKNGQFFPSLLSVIHHKFSQAYQSLFISGLLLVFVFYLLFEVSVNLKVIVYIRKKYLKYCDFFRLQYHGKKFEIKKNQNQRSLKSF